MLFPFTDALYRSITPRVGAIKLRDALNPGWAIVNEALKAGALLHRYPSEPTLVE